MQMSKKVMIKKQKDIFAIPDIKIYCKPIIVQYDIDAGINT